MAETCDAGICDGLGTIEAVGEGDAGVHASLEIEGAGAGGEPLDDVRSTLEKYLHRVSQEVL